MQSVPLHFQDANFEWKPVPWRGRDGTLMQRWVPFGMPRFRPEITLTTFYLYRLNPKTGEKDGPWGTGTFVFRAGKTDGFLGHGYAITNYHVAVKLGASIIRLNKLEDRNTSPNISSIGLGHRFLDFEPHEWKYIPGGDDLAAIDITDSAFIQNDLVRGTDEKDFVTTEFINQVGLTAGDDACMIGLFTGNPGTDFNLPAVRFGNISQMASFLNPIDQGNGVKMPSHIFDMHSRPGYSGSPVFVYRTPGNDLTKITEDGLFMGDLPRTDLPFASRQDCFIRLLGIHCGQFSETLKVETAETAGDPIREGDHLKIQSSMTIVVPAWAISRLLDHPDLEAQRKMREDRFRKSKKPVVQPESATPDRSEGEGQSQHKEAFTSLLNAAARTKPQAD